MRRLISAAVHNSVAANLLMVVIIVVGGMSAYNLRRETFPQISFDVIQVQTIFPGATPEAIEESIVVKIEEAIKSVEGIQDITSQANENAGVVLARLKPGMDNRRVLEDIQSEVEKIDTFPEDAEPTRFAELMAVFVRVSVLLRDWTIRADLPIAGIPYGHAKTALI